MPSIFVWKANEPNTSKKQIRYYSGSNWILEDNDYSSKSYIFLDQIVIPGFNDSVITFHSKLMPQDWIGSELLEVSYVPYEQIKSDNYGTLEKVGDWMRFISRNDIEFDSESLQNELILIKKWMAEKDYTPNTPRHNKFVQKPINYHRNRENSHHSSSEKIKINFQEFLIKYNVPLPKSESLVSISTKLNSLISSCNLKGGNINMGKSHNKKQFHNIK